jgi:hypothetical protein
MLGLAHGNITIIITSLTTHKLITHSRLTCLLQLPQST